PSGVPSRDSQPKKGSNRADFTGHSLLVNFRAHLNSASSVSSTARQSAGRDASSSVGVPLLSSTYWDRVGYKLGLATQTLCRSGSGKRKPRRSRMHYLYDIF